MDDDGHCNDISSGVQREKFERKCNWKFGKEDLWKWNIIT